jgi:hypothetical protein
VASRSHWGHTRPWGFLSLPQPEVCARAHTHTHTHTHKASGCHKVCTRTRTHTHTHTHTHKASGCHKVCTRAHKASGCHKVCTRARTRTRAHTHTHTRPQVATSARARAHTHTHTRPQVATRSAHTIFLGDNYLLCNVSTLFCPEFRWLNIHIQLKELLQHKSSSFKQIILKAARCLSYLFIGSK